MATLATNIAANVVSPANDFVRTSLRAFRSRRVVLITGVVGILIQPWKLFADPTGYIYRWLVAYSMLLGAIGGILITDYYVLRRTRLDLKAIKGLEVLVFGRLQPDGRSSRWWLALRRAFRVFSERSARPRSPRSGLRCITMRGLSASGISAVCYAVLMKAGSRWPANPGDA